MSDDLRAELEGRSGPYGLEQKCLVALPGLLAERDAATTKRERKQLSARIRSTRFFISWCRTRAGYRVPAE